jgi:hypothetical protein
MGVGVSAVFKSVDGGTSWSDADIGLAAAIGWTGPGARLTIDATIPATIYATSREGVYKTTDGAASWYAVNSGLPIGSGGPDACCGPAVVINPRDSNTLYVTSWNSALFKSIDGGASWHAAGSGLPAKWYAGAADAAPGFGSSRLAVDPRNSSTIYAATLNGIYSSSDGGDSFTAYSQVRADPVYSLALDPQRSGTMLAGGLFTGLSQSTDGGMSWLTGVGIGRVVALAIDPQNPNIVYAGIGDDECDLARIFQSADGGTSWIESWRAAYDCLFAIVIDPRTPGTVYAGSSDYGVIKSTDRGSTWNVISSGLPGIPNTGAGAPSVTALAIDPQNAGTLFAGLAGTELYDYGTGTFTAGVFNSPDGGTNWVGANSGIPAFRYDPYVTALAVDPQIPSTVYAAIATYDAVGGLWKSIDGGANWRNVFPANVYAVALDPQNPATIYAGTDNGLARSTDYGENWTMIPGGSGRVSVLALDPQDPNTVYAGGPGGLFTISFAASAARCSGDGLGLGAIMEGNAMNTAKNSEEI